MIGWLVFGLAEVTEAGRYNDDELELTKHVEQTNFKITHLFLCGAQLSTLINLVSSGFQQKSTNKPTVLYR